MVRRKILIIKFSGIGDILFFTPALRAIYKGFENPQITMMLDSHLGKDIFVNSPYVSDTIVYDRGFYRKNLLKHWRLLKDIRRRKYDLVIVSHTGGMGKSFFAFLSGAKERIGLARRNEKFFYTKPVQIKRDRHIVELNLDLARALGLEIKGKNMEIWTSEDDERFADSFFKNNGLNGNDLIIGVHAGYKRKGGYWGSSKEWPAERFSELCDKLVINYKAKIVIFGGEDDIEVAEKIKQGMNEKALFVVNKTTLLQTAALIKKCRLFICSDSGIMHIAIIQNVPTVSIWGPTDPRLLGPLNPMHTVVQKNMPCGPCYNYFSEGVRCKSPKCMEQITVEDVLNAVEELYKKL